MKGSGKSKLTAERPDGSTAKTAKRAKTIALPPQPTSPPRTPLVKNELAFPSTMPRAETTWPSEVQQTQSSSPERGGVRGSGSSSWIGQRVRCVDPSTQRALDGVVEAELPSILGEEMLWRVRLEGGARHIGIGTLRAAVEAAEAAAAVQFELRTAAAAAAPCRSSGDSGDGGHDSVQWSTDSADGGGFIGLRVARFFRVAADSSGIESGVALALGTVMAVLPATYAVSTLRAPFVVTADGAGEGQGEKEGVGTENSEPAMWRLRHDDGDAEDVGLGELRAAVSAALAVAKGTETYEELCRQQEAVAAEPPQAIRVGAAFQAMIPPLPAMPTGPLPVANTELMELRFDPAQVVGHTGSGYGDYAVLFLQRVQKQRSDGSNYNRNLWPIESADPHASRCAVDPHPYVGLTVRKHFPRYGWAEGIVVEEEKEKDADEEEVHSSVFTAYGGDAGAHDSKKTENATKVKKAKSRFRTVWKDMTWTPMSECTVRRQLKHPPKPQRKQVPRPPGHLGPGAVQDALHALHDAGYCVERALASLAGT